MMSQEALSPPVLEEPQAQLQDKESKVKLRDQAENKSPASDVLGAEHSNSVVTDNQNNGILLNISGHGHYVELSGELKKDKKISPEDIRKKLITASEAQAKKRQIKQRLDYYIRPEGTPDLNSSQRFELTSTIHEFIGNEYAKTAIIFGDSGAGKSFWALALEDELREMHADDPKSVLPVYIELRNFKRETIKTCISETLINDYLLSREEVGSLQKGKEGWQQKIVFILDGFDEIAQQQLHALYNIYAESGLKHWPYAKVIITCRTHYLPNQHEHLRLFAADPAAPHDILESQFFRFYVAPFSEHQITRYLETYLRHPTSPLPKILLSSPIKDMKFVAEEVKQVVTPSKSNKPIMVSDYQRLFNTLPGLKEMVGNPFILEILVHALPELLAARHQAGKSFLPVTRFAIYRAFMQHWFEREKNRLLSEISAIEDLIEEFDGFACDLAFEMFRQRTWKIHYKSPAKKRSLLKRVPRRESEHEHPLEAFFTERRRLDEKSSPSKPSSSALRACPIRRTEDHTYQFIHKSFSEFFVAKYLYEALEEMLKASLPEKEEYVTPLVEILGQRPLQEEPSILYFLLDEINLPGSIARPGIIKTLKEIISRSAFKTGKELIQASANAATLLNWCNVPFLYEAWPGVQLEGADLSHAILWGSNLTKANLQRVNLFRACLREVDVSQARVEGVEWGETPDINLSELIGASSRRYFNTSRRAFCMAYHPIQSSVLAIGILKEVFLYDTSTDGGVGESLKGCHEEISCLAFSPDGNFLAASSCDKSIVIWKVATRIPFQPPLKEHQRTINGIAFSPDSMFLASVSSDQSICFWRVGVPLPSLQKKLSGAHNAPIVSVAWSAKGVLASGDAAGVIHLWEPQKIPACPRRSVLSKHTQTITTLAFSADGSQLASGSADRYVQLWEVATGKPLGELVGGHEYGITTVAFSPEGHLLASGSADHHIRLWHVPTRQPIGKPFVGHTRFINHVMFNYNSTQLVSVSKDCTVRFWQVPQKMLVDLPLTKPILGHSGHITSLSVNATGMFLASASWDKTIGLWEVETGLCMGRLSNGHQKGISSVAFSPSQGMQLASGSFDGTVQVWDIETYQVERTLPKCHAVAISTIAFSPDGKQIASGDAEGIICIYQVTTHKLLAKINTPHAVSHLLFISHNMMIAVNHDEYIRVITSGDDFTSRSTVREMVVLFPHAGEKVKITCLTLVEGKKQLAVGSSKGILYLYDVDIRALKLNLVNQWQADEQSIFTIAFSHEGRFLISSSQAKRIYVWEVRSKRCVQKLAWHGMIYAVLFLPQRSVSAPISYRFVLGDELGSIGIFDIHPLSFNLSCQGMIAAEATPLMVSGVGLAECKWMPRDQRLLLQRKRDVEPDTVSADAAWPKVADGNLHKVDRQSYDPHHLHSAYLPSPAMVDSPGASLISATVLSPSIPLSSSLSPISEYHANYHRPPPSSITTLKKWARKGDAHAQQALLSCLKVEDKAVRLRAVQTLGKIGYCGKEVIAGLQALLGKDTLEIQQAVIATLEKWVVSVYYDVDVQQVLLSCLKLEDKAVRLQAVQALGKSWRGVKELVAGLETLLGKDTLEIQQAVIIILEKWVGEGDMGAQQALLPCLKSEDKAIRLRAVQALGKSWRGIKGLVAGLQALLGKDTLEIQQAVIAILEKWVDYYDDVDAQQALLSCLKLEDKAIRLRAVQAWRKSWWGGQEVITGLQALVGKDTLEIQQAAISTLEEWAMRGNLVAQQALLFHLASEDNTVRLQIAHAFPEVLAMLKAIPEDFLLTDREEREESSIHYDAAMDILEMLGFEATIEVIKVVIKWVKENFGYLSFAKYVHDTALNALYGRTLNADNIVNTKKTFGALEKQQLFSSLLPKKRIEPKSAQSNSKRLYHSSKSNEELPFLELLEENVLLEESLSDAPPKKSPVLESFGSTPSSSHASSSSPWVVMSNKEKFDDGPLALQLQLEYVLALRNREEAEVLAAIEQSLNEHTSNIPKSFYEAAKEAQKQISEPEALQQALTASRQEEDYSPSSLVEQLKTQAALYGFQCQEVDKHGNCLFDAVYDQLHTRGFLSHPDQETITDHKAVRQRACHQIIEDIIHDPGEVGFVVGDPNDYLLKLMKPGIWGDHMELRALSKAFHMIIVVINHDGKNSRRELGPEIFKPPEVNEHTPMITIGYQRGIHYQSLRDREGAEHREKREELFGKIRKAEAKFSSKREIPHQPNFFNKENIMKKSQEGSKNQNMQQIMEERRVKDERKPGAAPASFLPPASASRAPGEVHDIRSSSVSQQAPASAPAAPVAQPAAAAVPQPVVTPPPASASGRLQPNPKFKTRAVISGGVVGKNGRVENRVVKGEGIIINTVVGENGKMIQHVTYGQGMIDAIRAGDKTKIKNIVRGKVYAEITSQVLLEGAVIDQVADETENEVIDQIIHENIGTDLELSEYKEAVESVQKELVGLKKEFKLTEDQYKAVLEKFQQIEELKKELEEVKQELDMDVKSVAERKRILENPQMASYYQTMKKIHYHFSVAKIILSGKVSEADDTVDLAIKVASAAGKSIPGAGVVPEILGQAASLLNGIPKHRAMRRLAEWTSDSRNADQLSERFARQMAIKREQEILHPTPKEEWNKKWTQAHGITEKARSIPGVLLKGIKRFIDSGKIKHREIKEGRSYTEIEQLALTDTVHVLEAIMGDKVPAGEDRLDRMLKLFSEPQLSAAQAPAVPAKEVEAGSPPAAAAAEPPPVSAQKDGEKDASALQGLHAAGLGHFASGLSDKKQQAQQKAEAKIAKAARRKLEDVEELLNELYPGNEPEHAVTRAGYLDKLNPYQERRNALTSKDHNELGVLEEELQGVQQSLEVVP